MVGQELHAMGALGIYASANGAGHTFRWGAALPLEGFIVAKPAATQTIYIKALQIRASEADAATGYIQVYKMPGNEFLGGILGGSQDKYFNFGPDGFKLTPTDRLEFYVSYSGAPSNNKFVQAWVHFSEAL